MATIEEFLAERIREMEIKFEGLRMPMERTWDIRMMISNMRDLLDMHKAWPVMVQSEPTIDANLEADNVVYRMTQKIEWYTQEEYRKKFGSEPPTAPMIKRMVEPWALHPDFNPDWL